MGSVANGHRVGMRDVARVAGVSTQTVSRVLSGFPGIREETRARVLEAVAALGYTMNNTARALGTRTTRTLGLIASDSTLHGPAVAIESLDAAARAAGRWVATAFADAADGSSVEAAARHLVSQGVDGIVVLATHAQTLATVTAAAPGVPVRALHQGAGAQRQREGAVLAVEHLLALGHRRIARVAGPADWLEAKARDEGAARALPSGESRLRWEGRWSAASGAALAGEIAAAVRAPGGPTAIAVANDQMALGLIAGLRERGIVAPRDVSITGFDDNPDAAFYAPALTTVRLDVLGEARRVVGEVLSLAAPGTVPAPARLIVRESTARLG